MHSVEPGTPTSDPIPGTRSLVSPKTLAGVAGGGRTASFATGLVEDRGLQAPLIGYLILSRVQALGAAPASPGSNWLVRWAGLDFHPSSLDVALTSHVAHGSPL